MLLETKSGSKYEVTKNENGYLVKRSRPNEANVEEYTASKIVFARATQSQGGATMPMDTEEKPFLGLMPVIYHNNGFIVATKITGGHDFDGVEFVPAKPSEGWFTVKEDGEYPWLSEQDKDRTRPLCHGDVLFKAKDGTFTTYTGVMTLGIVLQESDIEPFDITGCRFAI